MRRVVGVNGNDSVICLQTDGHPSSSASVAMNQKDVGRLPTYWAAEVCTKSSLAIRRRIVSVSVGQSDYYSRANITKTVSRKNNYGADDAAAISSHICYHSRYSTTSFTRRSFSLAFGAQSAETPNHSGSQSGWHSNIHIILLFLFI